MDELQALLAEELHTDNASLLLEQLAKRAAWQARVSLMYRQEAETLAKYREKAWQPAVGLGGVKLTVDDRKIAMEAMCAEQQRKVDELRDTAEILGGHISLGQSMLKSMSGELRAGIR